MRAYLIKTIGIVLIIVTVLALGGAHNLYAASMNETSGGCEPVPCENGNTLPLCCITSDCMISPCVLNSPGDRVVILRHCNTPYEEVLVSWLPHSVSPVTSLSRKIPFPREPGCEIVSCLHAEYHCRDSLTSDEPPQA